MVLLKTVPIDGGKDTHTYMHVKNTKPNILYRFKSNESPTPLSLLVSLPEAECLEPRTANLGGTKCYILTGSPPTGPVDPGMGQPTGQRSQSRERRWPPGHGEGQRKPEARRAPSTFRPRGWRIYERARLSLRFPQGSKSPPALRSPLAHTVPRRLHSLMG